MNAKAIRAISMIAKAIRAISMNSIAIRDVSMNTQTINAKPLKHECKSHQNFDYSRIYVKMTQLQNFFTINAHGFTPIIQ